MLENFENFESNVLDRTQVKLTWLFHKTLSTVLWWVFERKHDVSGPQKSTEALTAAEDIKQLPRLKLVDGNILK